MEYEVYDYADALFEERYCLEIEEIVEEASVECDGCGMMVDSEAAEYTYEGFVYCEACHAEDHCEEPESYKDYLDEMEFEA